MDARKKKQTIVPQAQQMIKAEAEEPGESRSRASRGVLQRGGEGNGTAPAVVKAACKGKETADSVMQRHPAAISAKKTKAMEKKNRASLAAQKGKAAVKAAPKTKQVMVIISSDEEEEEEGEDSSDEDYEEEGESVDEDSHEDSEYEEEAQLVVQESPPVMADEVVAEDKLGVHEQPQQVVVPVVVEEAHEGDDDWRAIVRVKKFEGCRMLVEVEKTQDSGVASRTRRRKVLNLQRHQSSPLDYDKDSKGTFSDLVDV